MSAKDTVPHNGKTPWEVLREPFKSEQIEKKPQPTCRACTQAQGRVCDRHQKVRCEGCKQWITNAHVDLSYVGHAGITNRLLDADPGWNWEPAFRDVDPEVLKAAIVTGDPEIVRMVIENAPPRLDMHGGMWIRLTVGDGKTLGAKVTRLGYGDAQGKTGPNAVKELIGDALRNAAMRFGAGLELWAKGELHIEENGNNGPIQPNGQALADEAQAAANGAVSRAEDAMETTQTQDQDDKQKFAQAAADAAVQIDKVEELAGVFEGAKRRGILKQSVTTPLSDESMQLTQWLRRRKQQILQGMSVTEEPDMANQVQG